MRSNVSGAGFYNSEPRNFSRGFGRGNPKPYQSSQPPPSPQPSRRGDLFVEAGRLAVEYLVTHGLLSSNVLPGKFQNGSLRNNSGESQDHRSSQERELSNSLDGRSVATGRPRAGSPDGVSSSRRSPNDQDMSNSRSYSRERRKFGASRSYSSDWGRENGRTGSVPEKTSSSQPMEVDYDKHPKDSSKEEISDVHMSRSTEAANKDGRPSDEQHETEVRRPLVDLGSNIAGSLQDKNDGELPKPTDEAKEETKDGTSDHDKEEEIHRDELPIQLSDTNNDDSSKDTTNVTKVHSFLTDESLKSEPPFISEELNISEAGDGSCNTVKDDNMNGSSGIPSTNEIPSSSCPANTLSDLSFASAGALDPAHAVNQLKSVESLSFMEKGFSLEQESSGLPELAMCSSTTKDRGEKRAPEEDRTAEGAKRAKQWLSVAQSDEYLQLSDMSSKKPISVEKIDVSIFNESVDEGEFPNVSLPLKGCVESAMDRGEEKQLFSSSYKICDLNLMEASDMHENHGVGALLYPSLSTAKKDTHIDIDLSMSNSFTSEYNDSGSVRKDVDIIDLESSSLEECKSSKLSTKTAEAGITVVENFQNNPQHPNDNPDGQDGYGFMISELLGNDVPNCSTVQPDINSLHNDMGLHHGEGIFSEDDPIYMSLGEIPLTGLLRAWEQPTQDRNPFEL